MSEQKEKKEFYATPKFRVSFPNLFTPSAPKGSDKLSYSVTMLIPKTESIDALKKDAKEVAVAMFGADQKKWPSAKGVFNNPIQDGDKLTDNEHAAGCWVIKASSNAGGTFRPPHVVSKNPNETLTEKDVYAGCWARASVRAHAYDIAGQRGVKFLLAGVQKIADGKPIGGGVKATDLFGTINASEFGIDENDDSWGDETAKSEADEPEESPW